MFKEKGGGKTINAEWIDAVQQISWGIVLCGCMLCYDGGGKEIILSPEEQTSCLAGGNSLDVLFYTIITYACNIYRAFKVTPYQTWKASVSPLR